jgi:hypothetical protein
MIEPGNGMKHTGEEPGCRAGQDVRFSGMRRGDKAEI